MCRPPTDKKTSTTQKRRCDIRKIVNRKKGFQANALPRYDFIIQPDGLVVNLFDRSA